MNLNELQSVQSRERQTDSIQQLRDTFYQDVGGFIESLKTERRELVADDPDAFDSSEFHRLNDQIKTAESTVEAVYERRVGKLVKQASLEAAGMAADVDGLTVEERRLFDRLVESIEANRQHVLDDVIANGGRPASAPDAAGMVPSEPSDGTAKADTVPPGKDGEDAQPRRGAGDGHGDPGDGESGAGVTAGDAERTGATASEAAGAATSSGAGDSERPGRVDAADVMGGDPGGDAGEPTGEAVAVPSEGNSSVTVGEPATEPSEGGRDADAAVDRTVVRITADVGEIYGIDDRSYHLAPEDVVTLPAQNAGPLLEKGAAERLDHS